ncbi:MAG: pirin family protein [Myxococcota bacterium]
MITVRPSHQRGHSDLGWLGSHHTFSFSEYYDPAFMGFRVLRVINDDVVAPGTGFGTHGHRDMEIISYVLDGALEHKDSLGTGSVIRPGDVQRMSAGTGVRHSEWNHSAKEPVHFLQIWILPERAGIPPSYEQKRFDDATLRSGLTLVASPDGRGGSLKVHQDVELHVAKPAQGQSMSHALRPGRHAWVHVARGDVSLNGTRLRTGDGAAVSNEERLELRAEGDSEVLVFDLP